MRAILLESLGFEPETNGEIPMQLRFFISLSLLAHTTEINISQTAGILKIYG
jgi:hypothetical protein